jgi:hypothetical protein
MSQEQHSREEQEKLAALDALAAKGFDELDQGKGIVLEGRDQLTKYIGQVGRRASARVARSNDRSSRAESRVENSNVTN